LLNYNFSTGGENMPPSEREIKRKLRVLNHAKETGNISKICRFFGISRQSFYVRKRAFDKFGEQRLAPKKHGVSSEKSPLKTPPEIEEKILYIRRRYHSGQLRISWYLMAVSWDSNFCWRCP
jgi:transposase